MTAQQTWFLTGAGRGLGRALAEAALAAGHRVVATSRSGEVPLRSENLLALPLDVRDREACRAAVGRAVETFGGVDVLVNNAGYGLVGAVEEVAEDEARAILDTDLLGALWVTQAVLPGMREQGSGHIVQVSSVGGVGAMPFFGLYNAAKWGLEGFTEALAGEAREFGVRVTLAEPGAIDTEWGTGSMRFSAPLGDYDALRASVLGSAEVPWPSEPGTTGGGTAPADIAAAILAHVAAPEGPLRLLLGDDAPEQVAAVAGMRDADYRRDPRYVRAGDHA